MRALCLSLVIIGAVAVHAQPQQIPEQPGQSAFRARTDLVVVPFQVRRGSRPVSDLKPSEVVLLEDDVPRAFAGFEAPSDRPSLELVVMFDVTDLQPGGFWGTAHLHEFASVWNEAMARALFEEDGASVRVSVYQFNQSRLRRLIRSTSDPGAVLDAVHRLSEPIPASEALDFQLPAGTVVRRERPVNAPAWPFSLAGAMTALQDSAVGSTGARALVIFSTGAEGTTIRPEDLADHALAADVRVYPVALPSIQPIWYDGDNPNIQWEHQSPDRPSEMVVGPRLPENGICHDFTRRSRAPLESELSDCPLNAPFKAIANWTGGRSFEAARRPGAKLPHTGASDRFLGRFSMTATQVNDILDSIKAHALARFASTYRVWFEPPSSASPRKRKLEVKLVEKSRGNVTDGRKNATY